MIGSDTDYLSCKYLVVPDGLIGFMEVNLRLSLSYVREIVDVVKVMAAIVKVSFGSVI
jgi:hypothetical protein